MKLLKKLIKKIKFWYHVKIRMRDTIKEYERIESGYYDEE